MELVLMADTPSREDPEEIAHATHLKDGSGLYQVEDGWIETFTGRKFYFGRPTADMIDIDDIAHALSMSCRYNGHVKNFYSVAEHSVLMARWVLKQPQYTARDALTTLLHDAAETYISDLARPIKVTLPDFKALEAVIDEAVAAKYGTIFPLPGWLKELDARILVDEREQAMNPSNNEWGTDSLEALGVQLQFWTPSEAEATFKWWYFDLLLRCRRNNV